MGEQSISIFLVFFTGLLAFTLVLSKFLHDRPRLGAIVPEAAMVLAVGMLAGFFIHLFAGQVNKADNDDMTDDDNQNVDQDLSALLSFSPEIFFIALLPPIIFNSGLRIGTLFFRHFVPILGFAVFGTSIAAVSTALFLKMLVHFDLCGGFYPTLTELLTFGALISSTDPVSTLAVFQAKRVDPQLFYLVFGESVLNDALCIVLFNAFAKFVSRDNDAASIAIGAAQFFLDFFLDSIGSLCLGMGSGLATAYLFKQIDVRENRLIEISLYLLLVYVPFLLAEIMQLSGIVTILFTGVSANRYIVPNLSQITKVNADMLFRLLAHLAETSIFLELGLSVFGLLGHWNWKFIAWTLLVCLVARAMNIYPIAYCFNQLLLRGGRDYEDLFIEHEMKRFRKATRLTSMTDSELSETFSPSVQTEIDEGRIISSSMSMRSSTSESSTVTATPLKRKDLKVRSKTQHMMWFSGLRGAVAYACVRTFPNTFNHQKDFVMTTMAIVLITVYIMGGTTNAALNALKISTGVDEDQFLAERLREPVVPNAVRNFERKYIMPFVIRDYNVMQCMDGSENVSTSTTSRRSNPSPFIPHVEMTESKHLDAIEDYRQKKTKKVALEKHIRQDSLFDYGAN